MNELFIKKKEQRIKIINLLIYLCLFILFTIQNIFSIKSIENLNLFVILTFDIIGLLSFFNATIVTKRVNIFTLANIFIFIFFYYCGFNQYLQKFLAWKIYFGEVNVTSAEYIKVNCVIILFIIVMSIFYKMKINYKSFCTIQHKKIQLSRSSLILITIINVIILLFFVKMLGFSGLLSRHDSNINLNSTASSLIIKVCLRLIPPATFLFLMVNFSKQNFQKYFSFYIINGAIVFLLIFPLGGVARYMITAVYLSLLYNYIKKMRLKSLIILGVLFGIVVVFPTINFFRFHSFSEIKNFKIETLDITSGDFDAYSMLVYILKYTDLNGISYGKNFITAFLFFVPRSIWESKMIGTGAFIATSYKSPFTNISAPLIAENYFAFGVFGVIIGAIIFGIIIRILDNKYLSGGVLMKMISSVVFGMVLFILRGDLLSSLAYTIGFIISVLFVVFIFAIFGGVMNDTEEHLN